MMTATTLVAFAVLAEQKGPTGEASKSGPWGLAIILLLCLACYFLFKSMSRHMRKVREQFPTDRDRGIRPGGARRPPAEQPGRTKADAADDEPRGEAADPGAPPEAGA